MTAKEYLDQYLALKTDVKAIMERRKFYLDLAQKCTPEYGAAPGGGGSGEGKVSRYGCKAADKARELDERIAKLVELEQEIEGTIAEISDATARSVLTYKYINGWRLKEIADRMGYSHEYVRHLHTDALEMVVVPTKYGT